MTHVVLCVHHFPPDPVGGTERHVEALAHALMQRGAKVTVVAGTMRGRFDLTRVDDRHDGIAVVRIHREDFHFERWHRAHHAGVARLFGAILDELRPDVVHVHHWLRLTTDLAQIARARGLATVLSLHDYFATCPRITRIRPDGALCLEAAAPDLCRACVGTEYPGWDALYAESHTLRRTTLQAELRAAHRVVVLSQTQRAVLAAVEPEVSFDVQPFTTATELRPSPPPTAARPLQVGVLGRLNPEKGTHLLFEAVRSLTTPRAVRIHAFGESDEPLFARRLHELADGLDVVWHGRYEHAHLEQTPLHAICLPSTLFETYGLVLDEARQLGVPVLASDTGAYRERIGRGGLLFPPGDAEALRARLQRCLDEPELLPELRRGVTRPPAFSDLVDFLEACYADARAAAGRAATTSAPPGPPRDVDHARLIHELRRADRLERLLWQAHEMLKEAARAAPLDAGPTSPTRTRS